MPSPARTPSRVPLGHVFCSTHTESEFLAELDHLLATPAAQPRVLNALNAHIHNLAEREPALCEALNASRVVTADGMGVVWAARLLGAAVPQRCNMTEAFRAFVEAPRKTPVRAVLIGCTAEQARRAAAAIASRAPWCRIERAVSGYLTDAEILASLRETADPDLILIGMGTPRSERMTLLTSRLHPRAVVWHIGGGTILFWAGALREAPRWMRRIGLQWLHRLIIEPRRMWRRYLLGNPRFAARILALAIRRALSSLESPPDKR